jgi:hypothetical protein
MDELKQRYLDALEKIGAAVTDGSGLLEEAFGGNGQTGPTGQLMRLAQQCDKATREVRAAGSAWKLEAAEARQRRVVQLEKLAERMTATIKVFRCAKDEKGDSK